MKELLENRVLKAGVGLFLLGVIMAHSDLHRISDFGLLICGASFVFILAGGPLVESTRHVPALQGPLQAIGAVVIGVMLQLAASFAWHTIWPGAHWRQPDVPALGLTLLAAWLLIARQWPVPRVLAVCVVAGLALQGL